MEASDILGKVPLFTNLGKRNLTRLAESVRTHEFNKGDIIIREGDKSSGLFVVIEGICRAVIALGEKNERKLEAIGRYSYFGEMALIDELARSASVVAETDVKALSISQLNLEKEIRRNSELAIELLKTLSLRVRSLNAIIQRISDTRFPICLKCYKMCDADNNWVSVDNFRWDYSETKIKQPICPECHAKHFSPV